MRRGPLPSLGRKPVNQPARQIQGFSSLLTVRRNDDNNTRTQLYILIARMQNGEQVDLLIDRSQAVIVAMRNSLAKFQDEAV